MTPEPIILAIESSCDDTAAAVLRGRTVLSNVVAGQEVHSRFGGVVPELASRAHQQHIIPVADAALSEAGIGREGLDAVAFTAGPGLMGSLLVGASFAKGMALALGKPLLAVNHMKAHILAHMIEDGTPCPQFPFLCLTVSGGHTQLVHVRGSADMEVIGTTIDDAAGEAFDKAAKHLGLGYPGGPHIDRLARDGNPHRFTFARPRAGGLDFSFSGLKTSLLYALRDAQLEDPDFIAKNLSDICASYQHAVVSYLLDGMEKAARQTGATQVALAGGVSANSLLRERFAQMAVRNGWKAFVPQFQYCTDNAAMIGIAAHYQFLAGDFAGQHTAPMARLHF